MILGLIIHHWFLINLIIAPSMILCFFFTVDFNAAEYSSPYTPIVIMSSYIIWSDSCVNARIGVISELNA